MNLLNQIQIAMDATEAELGKTFFDLREEVKELRDDLLTTQANLTVERKRSKDLMDLLQESQKLVEAGDALCRTLLHRATTAETLLETAGPNSILYCHLRDKMSRPITLQVGEHLDNSIRHHMEAV